MRFLQVVQARDLQVGDGIAATPLGGSDLLPTFRTILHTEIDDYRAPVLCYRAPVLCVWVNESKTYDGYEDVWHMPDIRIDDLHSYVVVLR